MDRNFHGMITATAQIFYTISHALEGQHSAGGIEWIVGHAPYNIISGEVMGLWSTKRCRTDV